MGLFGSIGKFLFGGSKKTSKQTSSGTQTRSPYAPVIPYLNDYLAQTNNLYNGGTPLFSDMEQAGYNALTRAADNSDQYIDPSSYFTTSARTLEDTAAGKYLTPDTNPYLADIAKRVSGIAGANSASMFGGRGRTGSGLAGYYAGKAVGDSLTDMYGSAYESERNRQQQAAGMAPTFDATNMERGKQSYLAPQALISAGQNISARPFDVNQQQGGILSQIANLGGTTTQQGTVTNYQQSPGLFGQIVNSFTNKLFPGGSSGVW